MHILRLNSTGNVQKGLSKVEIGNEVGVGAAGFNLAWPTDEQWCVKAFLVHPALVEPAMLAKPKALVGTVDNYGVFRQGVLIKILEYTANIFIYCLNTSKIILDIALIVPTSSITTLKV